jgi:hypothetical protein
MSKAVAVDGDTQVVTSTAKHPEDSNNTGFWEPGELVVTTGESISVNGKNVELSAVMTWEYEGGTEGTNPVISVGPFSDKAELIAGPTKLTDANQHVLVEGDEATGKIDSGNKIIVTKSQDLLKTN